LTKDYFMLELLDNKKNRRDNPPREDLISVAEFAKTYQTRRGTSATPQYIYHLIKQAEEMGRVLDFEYEMIGEKKHIWIKKP
jgi:hypothetical protein